MILMDTIIFFFILCAFLAMLTSKRWLTISLFFVALLAMMLLFRHHVSDALNLSF